MTSDTKKEFLQKYMLNDYSRAVPANALAGKRVSLGDYSEPADSYKPNKKITEDSDDYSSDPDYRYAQPQDAVDTKPMKKSKPKNEDDGQVYELAQQPAEEYNVPPKKPSPKPRSGKRRPVQKQNSDSSPKSEEDKAISPDNASKGAAVHSETVTTPGETNSAQNTPRRRQGKKVVEIEYEVASEIKPQPPVKPLTPPGDVTSSIMPNRVKVPAVFQSANASSTVPHSQQADNVYSKGQIPGPGVTAESHYEEPWDLKAKRLKEEQEKKGKKLAKRAEKLHAPVKEQSVYEDAWDSAAQQRKLEERLSYARSFSQTSETDVFHDALDTVPDHKAETRPLPNPPADEPPYKNIKPLPQNTYEDAWDLKNSILEQKIRAMQIASSATYEEPWDRSKQQKELQAKFTSQAPESGISAEQGKKLRQRSSSDACDVASEGNDSRSSAKKYHSVDESKISRRGRGCNIGQRINPLIPLANQNWYHGNISRDDAEQMLMVCKEGSYIVRISSDRRSYSLSIKSAKQYIHVQIEQLIHGDGETRYVLGKNSKEFCSIPEMIDYYTHHRVPLKGAEHITLLHPVECTWS